MVCYNTHADIVCLVCAILLATELGGDINQRANLVNLVDVLDFLKQEGNSLEAHTGVDVLLWKISKNLKVVFGAAIGTFVLHEDEVPDLDVAILIGDRAALDTVGRAAVEIDFGARTSRATLTG